MGSGRLPDVLVLLRREAFSLERRSMVDGCLGGYGVGQFGRGVG